MISIAQFDSPPQAGGTPTEPDFEQRARAALAALAARPGYLRGSLARSTDEDRWVLLTEWESVGAYRRALGHYEVKLHAAPLLGEALDISSSFEILASAAPGGAVEVFTSDRT